MCSLTLPHSYTSGFVPNLDPYIQQISLRIALRINLTHIWGQLLHRVPVRKNIVILLHVLIQSCGNCRLGRVTIAPMKLRQNFSNENPFISLTWLGWHMVNNGFLTHFHFPRLKNWCENQFLRYMLWSKTIYIQFSALINIIVLDS